MCGEERCNKCLDDEGNPVDMKEIDNFLQYGSIWKCPKCGYILIEYLGDHYSYIEWNKDFTKIIKVYHYYQEAPLLGGL